MPRDFSCSRKAMSFLKYGLENSALRAERHDAPIVSGSGSPLVSASFFMACAIVDYCRRTRKKKEEEEKKKKEEEEEEEEEEKKKKEKKKKKRKKKERKMKEESIMMINETRSRGKDKKNIMWSGECHRSSNNNRVVHEHFQGKQSNPSSKSRKS